MTYELLPEYPTFPEICDFVAERIEGQIFGALHADRDLMGGGLSPEVREAIGPVSRQLAVILEAYLNKSDAKLFLSKEGTYGT